jgi:hypothetical protein
MPSPPPTTPPFNYLDAIVVSEDGSSVEIKDQNGNSITLNANGITINSARDINIVSQGNINVKAQQDLNLNGLNVNASAQVGIVAKGTATAELSAAGQTTVKGAMVMIN